MTTPNGMFACAACAHDVAFSGMSDAEGTHVLTGRTGLFGEGCCFCAAPATYELAYTPEVK